MNTHAKSYYLPLNHSARVCKGCKKTRSRAQYVGESEVCIQCARRGIAPTPTVRELKKDTNNTNNKGE